MNKGRRTAYLEFMIASRRWGHVCRTRIAEELTSGDPARVMAAANNPQHDDIYNDLLRKYDHVRLLPDNTVGVNAENVFTKARSMAKTVNQASDDARTSAHKPGIQFRTSERDWIEMVNSYYDTVDQFVEVAHRNITSTG